MAGAIKAGGAEVAGTIKAGGAEVGGLTNAGIVTGRIGSIITAAVVGPAVGSGGK